MTRGVAGGALALTAGALVVAVAQTPAPTAISPSTAIEHVVVIYQENVSFDHYFATYPRAQNLPGEPAFEAKPGTPAIAGLSGDLLTNNPNSKNPTNGVGAANPFRLDRVEVATNDQDHSYTQEQYAYDHGKMDRFPETVGVAGPPPYGPSDDPVVTGALNLGYFDGNTVTALWNYAQRFSLSDHFFQTTFGPSVIGAINLVSGQTNGIVSIRNGTSPNVIVDGGVGSFTVIGDADPIDDSCSSATRIAVRMGGRNIGNMLTEAGVTWGWFQAGFDLTKKNANGTAGCARSHTSAVTHLAYKDYVSHHEPFQYYTSTANRAHTRPTSVDAIGTNADAARHQYDLDDFYAAVDAGHMPTVSFIKPPAYQNGHAGYSDPLDEQTFLVHLMNYLQQRPEWAHTAILLTWDDSDGWYDHLMGPIVNSSVGAIDALQEDGLCGDGTSILAGIDANNPHALGRCGYGPRVPMLVISPWARENFVGSSVADQTSIVRFIEDLYLDGRRIGDGSFDALAGSLVGMFDFSKPPRLTPLLLDEDTGTVRH